LSVGHFHSNLKLAGKSGPIEALTIFHSRDRLLALPSNIGVVESDLTVTNALSYYSKKSVLVQNKSNLLLRIILYNTYTIQLYN
jgi:hypothetical protein